jgi:hypothetical protein
MRLALLAALLLTGCQLNAFDTVLTGETTVPGNGSGDALSSIPAFGSFSTLDLEQTADFTTQDVTKGDVNFARVTSLTLKIESPSDQDFSFLDDVSFFAKAGDQRVLIAQKQGVAQLGLHAPLPTLTLDATGADLTPFVTAPALSLEVEAHGRTPPRDVKLKASVDFQIRVKVF